MSHSDTWLGILIIAVFWALVSATVLVMSMQEEGTVGSLVLGELVRDGFGGHRYRNRVPFTPLALSPQSQCVRLRTTPYGHCVMPLLGLVAMLLVR